MAFGVQKQTSNGEGNSNGITQSEWAVYQFESIDVEATKSKRGMIKEFTGVGVCNFIMNLGWQPQEDQGYATKCALPEEGEDYSEEERAHMDKFQGNYFKWVEEKDGKKVRKQFRTLQPQAELVIAFDFNEYMLDHNNSPYGKGEEDLKPLRVSMNGWYAPKKSFNARVRNTISFKDKKMSENNPLYRIAKAGGVLDKFTSSGDINNGHDYALLAGIVCEFDISVELTKGNDGNDYVEFKIKNPSPVTDVKVKGKVVASKESLIQDARENLPDFVGLEFNDEDFVYTAEDLEHVRREWKIVASRAVSFKPSPIKYPDFEKGCNWADSTLYKACVEHNIWLPQEARVGEEENKTSPKPEEKPVEKKVEESVQNTEPETCVGGFEDIDDSIPF